MTLTSGGDARPGRSSKRLGGTLGTGRDLSRRALFHHVPLALASAAALVVLIAVAPSRGGFSIRQLASPTGDVALMLLGVTLLIGPAILLFRRRNPVNSYLRRDVGTWMAIWSITHVVVGFQGHNASAFGFVDYFVDDGRPLTDGFGMGNWTGLAATVIVVRRMASPFTRVLLVIVIAVLVARQPGSGCGDEQTPGRRPGWRRGERDPLAAAR